MARHKIYSMSFSSVYPLYLAKITKKNRTKEELDQIICWLTGYSNDDLSNLIKNDITFEKFINEAPNLNSNRFLITGVICGIRIEKIEDELMKEIRYLDKLVDELSKGKSMDKILRSA